MLQTKACSVVLALGLLLVAGPLTQALDIDGRIVSGSPAATGQFPWQVILKESAADDLLCGGSIISNVWVLTAAHCTYGKQSVYLMFGTTNLVDPNAVAMTSQALFIHSDYNGSNLNNDVSLIRLPNPLTFTRTIQPIPIVPSSASNTNFLGSTATIAGYGYTDDEYLDFSKVLLFAQVTIIDNSQCAAIFGTNVVIASTMCARGYNNTNMSICSGDSGGPLITTDANGNYMQIGINSFVAEDICTEGYPSGFVRLTSYLTFISQVTGMTF